MANKRKKTTTDSAPETDITIIQSESQLHSCVLSYPASTQSERKRNPWYQLPLYMQNTKKVSMTLRNQWKQLRKLVTTSIQLSESELSHAPSYSLKSILGSIKQLQNCKRVELSIMNNQSLQVQLIRPDGQVQQHMSLAPIVEGINKQITNS